MRRRETPAAADRLGYLWQTPTIKATLARLDRLEGAIVQITDVLVLQGERMDFGFKVLRDEMHALREETRAMHESLIDRLDRLIAITMKERTTSIERFASIEQRLARLEERVGI